MIIYGAILIPIAAAIFLAVKYQREVKPAEFLVFLISVGMIFGAKACVDKISIQDNEWWGGWVVNATYYEPWNEYVHQTCSRQVPCGTDSNGMTIYTTEFYDCSYVDYHPARWIISDSNGTSWSVARSFYDSIVQKLHVTPYFVDMHRRYHTQDGDAWDADWSGSRETLIPTTTHHFYDNKVQVAESVYHFPNVDDSPYPLFEYPQVHDYFVSDPVQPSDLYQQASKDLEVVNALLGDLKEVRILILVFDKQPLQAAFDQEAKWKGGNMNEFIVCIGQTAGNIDWVHVISWTEREDLKVGIRDAIQRMGELNFSTIIPLLENEVRSKWERRDFQEFNYLTVDPPVWVVVTVYVLTLLLTLGLAVWTVKNEI